MLSKEQNEILCRVEGDAPMGQLMRNYWLPAGLAEEVAEPDGKPLRTRVLGENLVVFRNTEGTLGALAEMCPHRKASLAFGRNEECGLRCLYHGWKFAVDGTVMDMASEPDSERKRKTFKHTAYPVHEGYGFVWVYLGAADTVPEFEAPVWASSAKPISIAKINQPSNWAQVLEGAIDSSHSSSLHSSGIQSGGSGETTTGPDKWLRPTDDKSPRMKIQKTNYGFRYAALRRPFENPEEMDYARITLFIAPFTVVIPPNGDFRMAQMLLPIDDENTMFYFFAFHEDEDKGIGQDDWRKFLAAEVGKELDENYRKHLNLDNWFEQDRDAMKRGDFTGIKGIPAQDMAMWESMGRIADRSTERLGASDLSIMSFRRQMVGAAKSFAAGGPPIGTTEPRVPHAKLQSFEGIVPKTTDWRTINRPDEEVSELSGEPAE